MGLPLRIAALLTALAGFLALTWAQAPGARPIPAHEWEHWNRGMFALAAAAFVVSLPPKLRPSTLPGLLYLVAAVTMAVHLLIQGAKLDRINTFGFTQDAPFQRGAAPTVAWLSAVLHFAAGMNLLRRRPPREG